MKYVHIFITYVFEHMFKKLMRNKEGSQIHTHAHTQFLKMENKKY